jgi:hypothetical protein
MQARLIGGPFDGMTAEGPDGSNIPDYLGFDRRGGPASQFGDATKPVNLLAWSIHDVGSQPSAETEPDTWSTTYKDTGRKDADGTQIYEHVGGTGDQEDL